MTTEDAIKRLEKLKAIYSGMDIKSDIEALDMAIQALKQTSVLDQIKWERDIAISQLKDLGYGLGEKPRTDGDLISRDYIIQQIQKAKESNYNFTYNTLIDFVKVLPSAEKMQEPKTGHWIIKDGKEQGYDIGGVKTWYIQIMCSECGFIKTAIEGHTGQYHFCPNCGCHMVEPQESEEEK